MLDEDYDACKDEACHNKEREGRDSQGSIRQDVDRNCDVEPHCTRLVKDRRVED